MDWILSTLYGLQEKIQANLASSSQLAPNDIEFLAPKKINDYVYEVCKPAGRPSVEIMFFHGLQLEHSMSKDTHVITWISRDKSELWLNWLLTDFPSARILTISYDAFPKKEADQGMMDMYCTCENLVHSLTGSEAQVGQDGCPVVLVGHCFGDLVMKELCVQAHTILNLHNHNEPVRNLLENIKGFFSYASPHQGSRLADSNIDFQKGPLFEDSTTLNLNTSRRNENFRKLRIKYGWKSFGVGESLEVTLGSLRFTGLMVPEASARHDVDNFYTVPGADHFTVCRPVSRQCGSFQLLSNFVGAVLEEDKAGRCSKAGFLDEPEIVGLEATVESVIEKLGGAQRLAIVGMGGIGKTTLAKAIFGEISRSFDYACFIEGVKKVIKSDSEHSPYKLRNEIECRLTKKGRKVSNFSWDTLKGKKVLIILDDVEFEFQVTMVTKLDIFSDESRVIVTCREFGFLRPLEFAIHEVKQLGLDDSRRLFCLHAFKQLEAPPTYEERVTRFAAKCAGLPLALKVSASYLCKKHNQAEWDEGLEKLSQAQPLNGSLQDGLWSTLRVSCDSLALTEREMFLDAATCFYGESLNEVQKAWGVCSWARNGAVSGWNNLLERCLVSEDEDGRISMHEVLRDLGQNIASHTRVFDIKKFSQLNEQEKATVKVLKLHSFKTRLHDGPVPIEYVDVAGLKELEILWLNHVHLHGCSRDFFPKVAFFKFSGPSPPKLGSIPDLIFKTIKIFPHASNILNERVTLGFQQIFQMIFHVRYIILEYEYQDMRHLPSSLCLLSQLESLEIVGCRHIEALPGDFGQLRRLHHFSIRDCDALEELPDSFALLNALKDLRIQFCSRLRISLSCLRDLRALKLQHLDIEKCKKITGEWYQLAVKDEDHWHLSAFQSLSMKELSLMGAVEDVGVVVQGCSPGYEISYRGSLASLPKSVGQPQIMRFLKITGFARELQDFGYYEELESLTIADSDVVELPNNFVQQLLALQELNIREWKCLKKLPNNLGQLQALEELKISYCPSLTELSETIGQLQTLEHLTIDTCPRLRKLPKSIGQLRALRHFKIKTCHYLKLLPYTLGQLGALEHLTIKYCHALTKLPDTLEQLGALEHLTIKYCDALTKLPDTLGQLRALERLNIEHCHALTKLPNTLGQLQALQHLNIQCDSLTQLPDGLGQLSALEDLTIKGGSLVKLPNTLGQLQALKNMTVDSCRSLTDLPDTLGELPTLVHLSIYGCFCLTRLPDTLGQLPALQHLTIKWCGSLTRFPDTLGQLQALQHLAVEGCHSLTELPYTLGELPRLEDLTIEYCDSLTELPDRLGLLQALQHLRIYDCASLTVLPEGLGQLSTLEHLTIQKCHSLAKLPDTLWQLPALQHLTIRRCASLTELPDNFLEQLPTLKHVEISSCGSLIDHFFDRSPSQTLTSSSGSLTEGYLNRSEGYLNRSPSWSDSLAEDD